MTTTHWFDPVIFSVGPLQVRWYGLMYVIGFVIAGFIFKRLIKEGFLQIAQEKIDSLITTEIIFMFIGSRTAYVFIYNWHYYSQHLNEVLAVWKGGLSFHGAVTGLFLGAFYFAKKNGVPGLQITDAITLAGPVGIMFGRIGNFINGELYGRVTDVPWGIVFPNGGEYPRHPSQLYESFFEGLVLFLILWLLRKRFKFYGVATGLFFSIYGVFRYFIEFFREADPQLGYYFGGTTTMGQILCILQVFAGLAVIYFATKKRYPIEWKTVPTESDNLSDS